MPIRLRLRFRSRCWADSNSQSYQDYDCASRHVERARRRLARPHLPMDRGAGAPARARNSTSAPGFAGAVPASSRRVREWLRPERRSRAAQGGLPLQLRQFRRRLQEPHGRSVPPGAAAGRADGPGARALDARRGRDPHRRQRLERPAGSRRPPTPRRRQLSTAIAYCAGEIAQGRRADPASHPSTRILLVGIANEADDPANFDRWQPARRPPTSGSRFDDFNAALRELAAGDPRVAFFDDLAWFTSRLGHARRRQASRPTRLCGRPDSAHHEHRGRRPGNLLLRRPSYRGGRQHPVGAVARRRT